MGQVPLVGDLRVCGSAEMMLQAGGRVCRALRAPGARGVPGTNQKPELERDQSPVSGMGQTPAASTLVEKSSLSFSGVGWLVELLANLPSF